jgi:CTP:molybdopterin cytidylyltransferase MocA
MTSLTGIVLAAGAGTRMGTPKALLRTPQGRPWLDIAVELLRESGCDAVLVVLGAAMVEVPVGSTAVIAADWAEGMSASLRAGLRAVSTLPDSSDAALVSLVDLPELPASVARRIVEVPVTAASLRQAVFEGRPGHPVLIGREHWDAAIDSLGGDRGARRYLVDHGVVEVECGDLFDGHDVDR